MEEAALFIHQIQSFFLQQKKELILIWFHEEWMESNYIITVIIVKTSLVFNTVKMIEW